MRVHRPLELAELLLTRDGQWPEVQAARVLKHRKETTFILNQPVAVVVEYITARVMPHGQVQWLRDLYVRDPLAAAERKIPTIARDGSTDL